MSQTAALALVDQALQLTPHRDRFTATELEDILLDVRNELLEQRN